MDRDTDAVILGAGAAGLMCAITAARRGRRVIVLDHAQRIGEKIRISGGGRCNFTNLHAAPAHYLSANSRFCTSALKRYPPQAFVELVEAHGIAYHEKAAGQLFCDGPATQIVDMLLKECATAGATVEPGAEITGVEKTETVFSVSTPAGTLRAPSLVLATGGKSIPKIGATGLAYRIATQFGLPIVPTRPGLVPLTFDPSFLAAMDGLAGVALPAAVRCGNVMFEEPLLFTHRGLSGPAILQISSFWREGKDLIVDLCPGTDVGAILIEARDDQPKKTVRTVLSGLLPKALAQKIAQEIGADGNLAETASKTLRKVGERVNRWLVRPAGTEGYRTAEVTLGGVDTRALSSKTFEARDVPGLYVIGEAVDVTGQLGGYNFQWAWASGHACGEAV